MRVKDKNQTNISIAEDDYEVAMGLLSDDDTQSEDEGYDDRDETFVPSRNSAPPIRGRSIALRSGRVSVQTVISYTRNYLQPNRREENIQQRQRRALRRQQRQESSQQQTVDIVDSSLENSQTSGCSLRENCQNIDDNDDDDSEEASNQISENVSNNSTLSSR